MAKRGIFDTSTKQKSHDIGGFFEALHDVMAFLSWLFCHGFFVMALLLGRGIKKEDCSWSAAIRRAGGFKSFCLKHAAKIKWVTDLGGGKVERVKVCPLFSDGFFFPFFLPLGTRGGGAWSCRAPTGSDH